MQVDGCVQVGFSEIAHFGNLCLATVPVPGGKGRGGGGG